jgi:hypothetical protein
MQTERLRERRRNKEVLTIPQRVGEAVAGTIFTTLVLAFFLYHQFANTGFFTSNFQGWAWFAFYGGIFLSYLPPILRGVIGRRNPVRPWGAFCNLFSAFSSLYLLTLFPFNFAHITDAFPAETKFALFWVTNDIGRIALALGFVGGLISAGLNIARYVTFTSFDAYSPTNKERVVKESEGLVVPILGSIFGLIGWLTFIILYALYWSQGFDLLQSAVVVIMSFLIAGLAIGAMWVAWLRYTSGRRWWEDQQRPTSDS